MTVDRRPASPAADAPPTAEPPPAPPITLGLMQTVATVLAEDIEDEQRRMSGIFCQQPHDIKMEYARVLRRMAELIDKLRANKVALEALGLKPAQPGGQAGQSS